MARRKKGISTIVEGFFESVAERLLSEMDNAIGRARIGAQATPRIDPFIAACGVVGVHPEDSLKIAEAVYKTKAKFAHPDVGGNKAAFQRLQKAMGIIRKRKKG